VPPSEDVTVGIGDDAAVTAWSSGQLVISTDMLLEDTHFTAAAGWRVIGRKAMAVSLSDMAAMAARPKFAVCAVGLDEERKPEDAKSLFEGMQEIAADFGCQIVGGDLTSWARPTAVCTTVVGEPTGKGPLTRAGAQAGDRIVVTGELGGSSAGKHLLFLPRVIEAIYLNQNYKINACIDISDGLGQDLGHILEESGKGALLYADAIPISEAARKSAARTGKTALEHALSDGEDFELVFTMPPAECERLLADTEVGTKVSVIGGITSGGYIIQDSQGKIRKYKPEGYVHFRSGGIREFKSSPQEPQSSDRNGPGT
jgi:thiamine-monophosphate kinase